VNRREYTVWEDLASSLPKNLGEMTTNLAGVYITAINRCQQTVFSKQ